MRGLQNGKTNSHRLEKAQRGDNPAPIYSS